MRKCLALSDENAYKKRMDIAAIILAAGQGTRLKSALPKPLHRIGGRPMLAWSLDAATAANAARIVTILPRASEQIQDWLDGVEFCIQDEPRGTGHAALAAAPALKDFNGVAVIMFADTPLVTACTINRLAASVNDHTSLAVLGFETADPTGYGRLVTDGNGGVTRIVEHRDATADERRISLVNGGIMAVRCPLLFTWLEQAQANNKNDEIYLTDIVELATQAGSNVTCQVADESEIAGVNDRADLAYLEAVLQTRLRQNAMQQGASFIAPETVFLSADTIFGQDVIIEPHVVIGPGTQIGEGSIIKSFSHIEGTRLGACCVIGPYARLRAGTDAGDGVKIGNFVETKKSTIGAGSKANHLTYIGDSVIGADVNVGAGTITCNYDGFGKFKTIIENGASIGSNTALVAPVKIGAGAIIGAGSTITADVPDDAIATTRSALDVRQNAAIRYRKLRNEPI
jgi:bifunctional UDP-N-acetylglucosamine pyrophosphorylase / glucosamine-1-phosphate N-acetyltransferase